MNSNHETALHGADLEIATGLRQLRQRNAPSTLAPAVLVRTGLADAYARLTTGLGPLFVAYSSCGVSALAPAGDPRSFEEQVRTRLGRRVYASDELPARLRRAVAAQVEGEAGPKLALDLSSLSGFERAVLSKALEIPRGEVRPYSWIAREIGRPRAVRAVGTALARNPIPLLIPCHRVVRSDGRVGNYAFGPEMKRDVLGFEGVSLDSLQELIDRGVRYLGSDTTHVYCYPTCRNARRITTKHRIAFRAAPAADEGYRPCLVCRPPLPV